MTETHGARSFVESASEQTAGEVPMLMARVGEERFAFGLAALEEALEWPVLQAVPGGAEGMLGIFAHRGQLVPVYTPARALGTTRMEAPAIVLVARAGSRRIGLALDDVEDVIMVNISRLQQPKDAGIGRALLGVVRYGEELVSIIDAVELVATCLGEPAGGGA